MKKQFLYLFGFLALTACTDDEDVFSGGEIAEPVITPENKPNDVVTGDVFAKLNLDYPGLEKVKQHYEADEQYYAALALLDYYRNRNISNPEVDLITPSISATDQRIADQALEHRFRSASFVEDEGTGNVDKDHLDEDDTYYLFDDADGNINWNMEPENTGREFRYQTHRHQWMEPQAKAYRISRNEEYVRSWIEVYQDWMNAFPCPNVSFENPKIDDMDPSDTYQWKGLQTAERVLTQTNILPYFIYSDNFTPEWLTTFLNMFADHVEMIRLNYYIEGNIRITQAQAVATAGVLMPEFKNSEAWVDEGCQILNEELDKQFLDDGVHAELDFSYHIAAVSDFLSVYNLAQVAQSNGKSIPLRDDCLTRLKASMNFVKDMTYLSEETNNYAIDNFNDTRSARFRTAISSRLNDYSKLFPEDRELEWMATKGKSGTVPSYLTKAYKTSGYYILRSGWTKNDLMMVLKNNYDPEDHWHCQPDNGTFGIYRKGRSFFPDAGCFAYDEGYNNTKRAEYRRTLMHNTMTRFDDNIEAGHRLGKLLKLETTSDNTDVLVTENNSYEGITHRRTVFFVQKKFFVLVDEVYGTSKDKVKLNFHIKGADGTNVVFQDLADDYQSGMYTKFDDGNNMLVRTFLQEPPKNASDFSVKKLETKYSNDQGQESGDRTGYQITTRKVQNGTTRFVSVIYPIDGQYNDGMTFDAQFTDVQESNGNPVGASVKVTANGETYDLSYTL